MPVETHLIIGLSFGKINDAKTTFSETLDLSEPRANFVHTEGELKDMRRCTQSRSAAVGTFCDRKGV
jgi:hypothetical protein